MQKKIFLFTILSLFVVIFIANFFISKSYNDPKNIEKRAIKYCIDNGYEYRETQVSSGEMLKQCKINGSFIGIDKISIDKK